MRKFLFLVACLFCIAAASKPLLAHSKQDTLRFDTTRYDSVPQWNYESISDSLFYSQIVVDTTQVVFDSSKVLWVDSHAVISNRHYRVSLQLETARQNSSTLNSSWQTYYGYHQKLKMYLVLNGSVSSESLGFATLDLYDLNGGIIYPLPSSYDGACSAPLLNPSGTLMLVYDYCPDCPDEESYVHISSIKKKGCNTRIAPVASVHIPGLEEQWNDASEINAINWGKDGNIYIRARKYTYIQAERREDDIVGYICCAYYRIDLKQKSKPTE